MKKLYFGSIFSFLLILSSIFLLLNRSSIAVQEGYGSQDEYVPNEVLVKFKQDVDDYFIQNAVILVDGKVITYLKEEIDPLQWTSRNVALRSFRLDPNLLHIKVPEFIGTEQAIYLLSLNPRVEYAEKNFRGTFDVDPNDDHFTKLWGMKNTGQTGGKVEADIDANDAWDIFTGSSDIVVAVIDTGVDYDHIDLDANIWTNPGETGGGKENNGIDDDNNGYKDDFRGWDFADFDNDPKDEWYPEYHGTHVAGIIGAIGNNDEGVVGVNWNVKIMVLKMADEYGDFSVSNCIGAIDYSTANGAHLSNNSWKIGGYSQALYDSIERAKNCVHGYWGKLFVASAGNDNKNNDSNPHYPSGYDLDNIIAVLATDHNDDKAGFSNYGKTTVDIGAPGGSGSGSETKDIYSTRRGDGYQYKWGTSMAAPHVAGVAALVLGKCPPINWDQLKQRIISKKDYITSLRNKCVAKGRVNAKKSVYDAYQPGGAPSSCGATPTAWNIIRIYWTDNSDHEIGFEVQRKKAGEANFYYLRSVDSGYQSTLDEIATAGITHYYKVRAYNLAGLTSFTNTASATIPTGLPAAPSNLRAHNPSGPDGVILRWSDNSNNEEYFVIERKSFSDPMWQELDMAGPNETIYIDENVQAGETYWYRLRAYNPTGYSGYSNTIEVEIIIY